MSADPSPAVRIAGLARTYGRKEKVHALDGIDLDIAKGEMLVLLGPSGCGKSTMLRCLAGLERPTRGRIEFDGRVMSDSATGIHRPTNRRDIGLVFQTYVLWPHMTLRQNVAYPLRARGLGEELRGGRVEEMLAIVECDHLADRYPGNLSGGQQQRVALARAMVSRPELILLDEPLSNLDALLRVNLRAQLREIHRRLGFTGVYVTHDQTEALGLGDRVAVMQHGRVAQIATPRELFERPASEYVADFLGVRNRVAVEFPAAGETTDGVRLTGSWADHVPHGRHTIYFRPGSVSLLRPETASRHHGRDGLLLSGGHVVETLYGGEESEYVTEFGGRRIHATGRDTHGLAAGDAVAVSVPIDGLLVYDTENRLIDHHRPPVDVGRGSHELAPPAEV